MAEPLHLLKVPLWTERLAALAKRRGLALRELDEGYLAHSVLRELWQARAPQPFVVRSRRAVCEVWGYGGSSAQALVEHASTFADPELLRVVTSLDDVASRPVPVLPSGKRVGFTVRVCPVVRLSSARGEFRAGAELDVFVARSLGVAREEPLSRETLYREWFHRRWGDEARTGVRVERVRLTRFGRERITRRTQGGERQARSLERPDVELAGELTVMDGGTLVKRLGEGVGRHKAFGYGALMLVPPGSDGVEG